jgi:phosphoribosylformylglycinamidine cyclo-ligase
MPGFYGKGEYDLAGFAIGVVERKRLITGSAIRRGDKIIGLASSGLHSNGYSLARKLLFDDLGLNVKSRPIGFKRTMGKTLLEPTRIYVKPVLKVTSEFSVNGVAHITGGGLIENIPRIIPKGLKAVIEPGSWPMPKIFGFIKANGPISDHEMLRTFNCGIGMVIVVRSSVASAARDRLNSLGEKAHIIGEIRGSSSKAPVTEFSGPLGWK